MAWAKLDELVGAVQRPNRPRDCRLPATLLAMDGAAAIDCSIPSPSLP